MCVRVLRGRAAEVAADRAATRRLVDAVRETGEPAVRVWQPHRQVAFGRRDARTDGYRRARRAAAARGYAPVERRVGGRAVAYTGTTVAFARVEPVDGERTGVGPRYEAALADLREALAALGVDAREGEPPEAFCPGTHSLRTEGKLAGLAQRVGRDAATVGGVLVVADHRAVADVLAPVYGALGVPFDPDTVGSLARAGSDADPATVVRTVERALVGGRETTVERVEERDERRCGG